MTHPTPDIQAWGAEFNQLHQRISAHFSRCEPRERVLRYLRGLLLPVERKNAWQLAEATGDTTPDGVQRLLNDAKWDADAVRDELCAYVIEQLGSEDAIWVLDETGFLKKGEKSVGVQRQYSGTAGRIENCQIGVFLYHWNPEIQAGAFLDRELYLPKSWTTNPKRCLEVGILESAQLRKKGELARAMLERTFASGARPAWVTGDSVYGSDRRLRIFLEQREQAFVLGIKRDEALWVMTPDEGPRQIRADIITAWLAEEAFTRLSIGHGAKGERIDDWAVVALARLMDKDDPWKHQLLVRRNLAGELSYYVVFAPKEATLEQLARTAGARWSIEMGFEETKSLTGLDEYEVRKYTAWYRHITLSLLAHAFLNVVKVRARSAEKSSRTLIPFTVPEVRRLLVRLLLKHSLPTLEVLAWSAWRRCHQARAKAAHYRRRAQLTN